MNALNVLAIGLLYLSSAGFSADSMSVLPVVDSEQTQDEITLDSHRALATASDEFGLNNSAGMLEEVEETPILLAQMDGDEEEGDEGDEDEEGGEDEDEEEEEEE